jgi:uncharacterized membrane protein YhaH (DUF805 family)
MLIYYWKECWSKCFNFSGRSRRSEFFYFQLMNLIIIFGTVFLTAFLTSYSPKISTFITGILMIYYLCSSLPSLAVMVRRMHDTNHSGLHIFIPLFNLILLFMESDEGSNNYGEDPKRPYQEADFEDIISENF